MKKLCESFVQSLSEEDRTLVLSIHDQLIQNDCLCEEKEAKSGFVVSYVLPATKRTIATFVTRKSGIKVRIYAEHISQYQDVLDTFPQKVKAEIVKASTCKRLVNPADCNPRCPMGYTFVMEQEQYQKCRYMAFLLSLNEVSLPWIQQLLDKELSVSN